MLYLMFTTGIVYQLMFLISYVHYLNTSQYVTVGDCDGDTVGFIMTSYNVNIKSLIVSSII